MGLANPSLKRKPSNKADHPPKKSKVATRSIVGEIPDASKLPPKPVPRKEKGLMTGQVPTAEKCPVLLHEDSRYTLSSIIKDDDYEDLGNHATKGDRPLQFGTCMLIRPFFLFRPIVVSF